MALIYFTDEQHDGPKAHMSKVAARRYIDKAQKKAADHLALAERWGAKAVEFEKEKLVLKAKLAKVYIVLGVVSGYAVLSTVIWITGN